MTIILVAAGFFIFGAFIGFAVSKRRYDQGFTHGERHGRFLGFKDACMKRGLQILNPQTGDFYNSSDH